MTVTHVIRKLVWNSLTLICQLTNNKLSLLKNQKSNVIVTNCTHQKKSWNLYFSFIQSSGQNESWLIYLCFHLLLNRSFINFCFNNDIGIALHCCVWFHWIGLTVNNIFIFQVFFSQLLYCHDHTPKYEVISECWLIWHFINKLSNSSLNAMFALIKYICWFRPNPLSYWPITIQ